MGNLLRQTVWVFIFVFAATALLTIAGLAYLWFGEGQRDTLPHLDWLLYTLVAEVIAVVVLFARRSISYIPESQTTKSPEMTAEFIATFIAHASSVTIVTNRAGWLTESADLLSKIESRRSAGANVEIITPGALSDAVGERLRNAGVVLIATGEKDSPEARFTLINGSRGGSARLAIARGTYPRHEILVFDSDSGPQIIGMARDLVRKSKETANAKALG